MGERTYEEMFGIEKAKAIIFKMEKQLAR